MASPSIRVPVTLALLCLATMAFDVEATAQRTFVASYGADTNPCNLVSPCRSFGTAIAQTTAGGEIVVLDSAGYGPVVINQAASILAPPGIHAGISVSAGTGVTVNAGAGSKVTLRGLTIIGLGGTTGIAFQSGAALYLDHLTVNGFNAGGAMGVNAAIGTGTSSLFIRDSAFRDNAIGLATDTTSGTLTLDIERAMFERNAIGADVQGTAFGVIRKSTFSAGGVGISAGAANSGQTVKLDIRDCTVSDNAGIGIAAVAPLSPTTLTVISSSVSGNATGIQATGDGNAAYASDNTIMRNGIALSATSLGTVLSGGDNRLFFNISDGIFATQLINGALQTGSISLPNQVATWTFNASAGDRIGVHIGEITDNNDFRPWIRLQAPDGTIIGNTSGVAAAALDGIAAPQTGTYFVLVASFDSGFDGSGTYRLTMTHTPGPITVSPGDQGGPLTNGAMHTGEIVKGDVDIWTFNATAGDRIGVHVGEIVDNDDFRPWLRLWAPNGAVLANTSGVAAAVIDGVAAPVTGTYLVLVSSFDSGFDGTGTYGLTMTHTPGPITVSPGDQGGPLANGALHTGEIVKGDLDVWTFNANVGDRIGVHIGEIVDNDDFRPWIRLWAPNGAVLDSTSGVGAAVIDGVAAPQTGTYFVLVASFDSGFDGSGTYRLTMTHTPGPITVSPGDQGGPLTNGAMHTGEIVKGDVDIWTFNATAGDRIGVHVGEIVDNDDFRPWIRLWAPNGAVLANTSGVAAAVIDGVAAPVTGTYLVLVSSFDSGFDGTGTYGLTMTHTPGPITVSPGDQGGPLTNGALHTGEIVKGDLDVWTFNANVGDRIGVHIGEIVDNDDLRPWIRLWAPDGTVLANTSGTDAAVIDGVAAPVTGTYLVLVASFDSGFDGTGTYRLTMTHTPGPITVSPGDQGGPLTAGAAHGGEIVQGDLDVWTINVVAGQQITVQITETSETDDFRPWIRLWGPNGAILGASSGLTTAQIGPVLAPVTGTYLVLVGSFDSGFDGTGTFSLTVNISP